MAEQMTSRERVLAALRHEEVDRFPRMVGRLPYVNIYRAQDCAGFDARFEMDFGYAPVKYGKSRYAKGESCRLPGYTDEFGSRFELAEDGVVGEVKSPLLADWRTLDDYELPCEMLDGLDVSATREYRKTTDKFLLAGSFVRPFERMQFLRGSENLFIDLAEGEPYVEKLLSRLHEFGLKELSKLAAADVDAISFMDDWGSQVSLLISPQLWRQLFKPLYKDYCELIHSAGKQVFFHSDGFIEAIYPDLVEIGVDAINSQLFCMNIEDLAEKYAKKITFWGEIDRQYILGYGTTGEVKAAVDRLASAVIRANGGRTGLIAQCEWGSHDPVENIEAVFSRFEEL